MASRFRLTEPVFAREFRTVTPSFAAMAAGSVSPKRRMSCSAVSLPHSAARCVSSHCCPAVNRPRSGSRRKAYPAHCSSPMSARAESISKTDGRPAGAVCAGSGGAFRAKRPDMAILLLRRAGKVCEHYINAEVTTMISSSGSRSQTSNSIRVRFCLSSLAA